MEHRASQWEIDAANNQDRPAPEPRRRFGIVSVLIRLLLAIVILAGAFVFAQRLIENRPEPMQRSSFERSFTVEVMPAVPGDHTTRVSSFGEVVSGTSLDVRTTVGGAVIDVSPNLRAGGSVSAGEVLVELDPYDYELILSNARNDLSDARLAVTEANQQIDNLELNVEFSQQQYDVAVADFERAQTLFDSGSLTNQELESRRLVVSQREQALRQAESNLALQRSALERNQADIARAERAVEQAERTLIGTSVYAPFDGVVVTGGAVIGQTLNANETVASLYDEDKLEVRFSLSERDFGRLTGDGLVGREIEAVWNIEPEPVVLTGAVSRIGAEVDPTLGGVELFASLDNAAETLIRPGTFVAIELAGLTYPGTYRIPETAVYEDDHFYILDDGRMQRVDAAIRARDGEFLIVQASPPEGARIITSRLAQAGEGVRVEVEGEEQAPGDGPEGGAPAQGGPPEGGGRPGGPPGGGG